MAVLALPPVFVVRVALEGPPVPVDEEQPTAKSRAAEQPNSGDKRTTNPPNTKTHL
jgi:hypothetical protein